jgi:hypothetical protein
MGSRQVGVGAVDGLPGIVDSLSGIEVWYVTRGDDAVKDYNIH